MGIITIIGTGMMGSAMARPATDNGHEVRMVGTPLDRAIIDSLQKTKFHPTLRKEFPAGIKAYQIEELDRALEGADLVVGGVSSFGVDWFAEAVLPHLAPGTTVLSVTKGLRNRGKELIPFPHLLAEKRPDVHFNAIGGPCICFELFDRRHTMVYFCGDDMEILAGIREMLATDYYHIQLTNDVFGIEGCVALKNAYAMGVSLAVGIADREVGGEGDFGALCRPGAPDRNPVFNPQAALFGQSCVEMRRIVELIGGNGDFAGGLPGAGDLYVTVFGGRTRRLGTLLGRGLSFGEAQKLLDGVTLEAVAIISAVAEGLRQRGEDEAKYPLLMLMDKVINKGAEVVIPWDKLR